MGEAAVPDLREALRDEELRYRPLSREAAIQALVQIGPESAAVAEPELRKAQNDPDMRVREAAVSALDMMCSGAGDVARPGRRYVMHNIYVQTKPSQTKVV